MAARHLMAKKEGGQEPLTNQVWTRPHGSGGFDETISPSCAPPDKTTLAATEWPGPEQDLREGGMGLLVGSGGQPPVLPGQEVRFT